MTIEKMKWEERCKDRGGEKMKWEERCKDRGGEKRTEGNRREGRRRVEKIF